MDEVGWLIEEDARGITHWIALAKGQWPRTTRSTHPYVSDRYQTPVERVKDANLALRFARKEDAEAFIELFDRFLLNPEATEHCWPALRAQTPSGSKASE